MFLAFQHFDGLIATIEAENHGSAAAAFLYERVHVFHIDVLAGQGFQGMLFSPLAYRPLPRRQQRFAQR